MVTEFTKRKLGHEGKMAEEFVDNDIASALEKAVKSIRRVNGKVATLPLLLHYGCFGQDFTSNSQEYLVIPPNGKKQIIFFHGDGIFSDPERLRNAEYEPLSNGGGIRLTDEEHDELLRSKINGKEVRYFKYEEINEIPINMRQFGIVLDYDDVKGIPSGRHNPLTLHECPLFGARTVHQVFYEGAMRFVDWFGSPDKIRQFYEADQESKDGRTSYDRLLSGSFSVDELPIGSPRGILHQHPYDVADPNVPQAHIIFQGSEEYGLASGYHQFHSGRYVGLCPQGKWMSSVDEERKGEGKISKLAKLPELVRANKPIVSKDR